MNIDKRNPDWLYETFVVICTVATVAMDLVAKSGPWWKHIRTEINITRINRFYNAGEKALRSWIKGEIP